jgi:HEAT repeat protein
MKPLALLILGAFSLATCLADIRDMETLLRSILSQQDESRIPTPEEWPASTTGDAMLRNASPEQIQELLPLAKRCLESSKLVVRKNGMTLLLGLSVTRPDSATLLAPALESIASLLSESDAGLKQGAIYVLGNLLPKPGPNALAYLAAHLNDERNTGTQFMMISGAFLLTSPSDPDVIRNVLAALQRRPDHELLTGAMIEGLGQQKITTDDAIQFIRSGLSDKIAAVRTTAVEAVGHMPKEIRAGFAADLLRLMASPDETPETRTRAREVLIQ